MKKRNSLVNAILEKGDPLEILALFSFTPEDDEEIFIHKYRLWCRYFFPMYFYDSRKETFTKDAPFHKEWDRNYFRVYKGESYPNGLRSFVNIASRGFAKTTRTKLFCAFMILNDATHYRKYIKVLTKDIDNAKQIVTDTYNMLITPNVQIVYGNVFEKTDLKKEERMDSFTTTMTGIKMVADTVGVDQRGALQDYSRPDFQIYDDFETRLTLASAVITHKIWDNMEEAKTALSVYGGALYNCNYISERGNVHRLIQKENDKNVVLITPIRDKEGNPNWQAMFTKERVDRLEQDVDDFAGEYLCEPSAGFDIYFDRTKLKEMPTRIPKKTVSDFKMFYDYVPGHMYAMGHDVAGGVGLDSSTTTIIDFSTIPNRVVATYKSNTIAPDVFGYEIMIQGGRYGECLSAPEQNNHGHATIAILKLTYPNIYYEEEKAIKDLLVSNKRTQRVYGFRTTTPSKRIILSGLKKAVEDGHLELSDPDLIAECIAYSRDDLMDSTELDPRLTTRHFDLLMSCAIAYHMRNYAIITESEKKIEEEEENISFDDYIREQNSRFDVI